MIGCSKYLKKTVEHMSQNIVIETSTHKHSCSHEIDNLWFIYHVRVKGPETKLLVEGKVEPVAKLRFFIWIEQGRWKELPFPW